MTHPFTFVRVSIFLVFISLFHSVACVLVTMLQSAQPTLVCHLFFSQLNFIFYLISMLASFSGQIFIDH